VIGIDVERVVGLMYVEPPSVVPGSGLRWRWRLVQSEQPAKHPKHVNKQKRFRMPQLLVGAQSQRTCKSASRLLPGADPKAPGMDVGRHYA
jgi:hypothetical protein